MPDHSRYATLTVTSDSLSTAELAALLGLPSEPTEPGSAQAPARWQARFEVAQGDTVDVQVRALLALLPSDLPTIARMKTGIVQIDIVVVLTEEMYATSGCLLEPETIAALADLGCYFGITFEGLDPEEDLCVFSRPDHFGPGEVSYMGPYKQGSYATVIVFSDTLTALDISNAFGMMPTYCTSVGEQGNPGAVGVLARWRRDHTTWISRRVLHENGDLCSNLEQLLNHHSPVIPVMQSLIRDYKGDVEIAVGVDATERLLAATGFWLRPTAIRTIADMHASLYVDVYLWGCDLMVNPDDEYDEEAV